jgi:hypothetical protein
MSHHLRTDLGQLLFERRQRPVPYRLWRRPGSYEVAEIVGERVKLKTRGECRNLVNLVVPDTLRIGLVLPNYRNSESYPNTSASRQFQTLRLVEERQPAELSLYAEFTKNARVNCLSTRTASPRVRAYAAVR